MRVAVWNMSHWSRSPDQRRRTWEILREESAADVALVQEAVPPDDLMARSVYRAIGGSRPWGSAVVGLTVNVTEVVEAKGRYNSAARRLEGFHPGSVAVATVPVGRRSITLVSMYWPIDDGYADTTVQRQLSDLVPLFDDQSHEGRILLGGDLNITTQWIGDQRRYRAWDQAVFTRMAALGLRDCLDIHRLEGPLPGCDCDDGGACRHIHTQRHAKSQRPWQNDYLWASSDLITPGTLVDAKVYDSPSMRELGDHLPLIAEFAI